MNGLLFAPAIALAILFATALVLAAQKGRQHQLMGRVVRHDVTRSAVPSILFFTGATCSICHTAQKPALASLAQAGAPVDIREIDVADQPDMARAYRVMTLPTTVVLDPAGRVSHINVGFAPAETLRAQLAEVGGPVAA